MRYSQRGEQGRTLDFIEPTEVEEKLETIPDKLVGEKVNFLDSYYEYASHVTDAPVKFHEFMALVTAGIVMARHRYFQFGHQRIYPNFYLVILAPSSLFRKSTALSISQGMIRAIDPMRVYPSDFSQEKIMETLKETPTGAFYYYEFKSLMELMNRDYMASAKSFFTELYDCNDMGVARISKSFEIKDPCCSIIAATTSDWFTESIKRGDVEGGFLGRFIFVYSKVKLRDDSIPPDPDIKKWAECMQELRSIQGTDDCRMTLSPEARERYDVFYRTFAKKYEDMNHSYRTLFARLNIYCIKLAMVLETCTSRESTIGIKTLEKAIYLVSWLTETTIKLCQSELSFSKSESQEKKVLAYLEDRKTAPRSEVLRASHLSSKEMDSVINTLVAKELVILGKKTIDGSHKQTEMIPLNGHHE